MAAVGGYYLKTHIVRPVKSNLQKRQLHDCAFYRKIIVFSGRIYQARIKNVCGFSYIGGA
jgi:hypothetical protein